MERRSKIAVGWNAAGACRLVDWAALVMRIVMAAVVHGRHKEYHECRTLLVLSAVFSL